MRFRSWPSLRLAVGHFTLSLAWLTVLLVIGVKPDQWKRICAGPVIRLDEYSDTLLRNLRTFLQIGDIQGAQIIQSSCVGCLAHLAVLCDLISYSDPNSKLQMDTVCDSSLERLGHLTQEMRFEEYTYFDLLLRVCHRVDFYQW